MCAQHENACALRHAFLLHKAGAVSARCEDAEPVTIHRPTCPEWQSDHCQSAKRKTSGNCLAASTSAYRSSESVRFRASEPCAVQCVGGGDLGRN